MNISKMGSLGIGDVNSSIFYFFGFTVKLERNAGAAFI